MNRLKDVGYFFHVITSIERTMAEDCGITAVGTMPDVGHSCFMDYNNSANRQAFTLIGCWRLVLYSVDTF